MSLTPVNHEPLLSSSCSSLDSNELGSIWTAVHKCRDKERLNYMSWRRWHCQQQNHVVVDNKPSLILSAAGVHDAYSHEVPQSTQKCYPPTIHHHASTSLSRSSSFCKTDTLEDDEEDDYYLSDDDIYDDDDDVYEDEDDVNYHFVRDFTKTQPRPATPRRSLLSDLLQRAPSLLSNSSCSFTSNNSTTTQSSIVMDNNNNNNNNNKNTTTLEWRESFHGW